MDPGSDNQSVGATTSSSASRNSSAIRQAQEDVSQGLRLNFTKKLYGRCEELTLLQEAFQRVLVKPDEKNDSTEIALVHGDSGCGKSSLVLAFRDAAREKHEQAAFFLEGKFDQNPDASRPYSAIVDAVTQLCLTLDTSGFLPEIQQVIENRLSSEIGVLSNLIPAMEVITREMPGQDEQAPTGRRTGNYAFKLFMDTFRSFLKLVCQVHPVVMFLDDLQWVDEESRQVISKITADHSLQNFFFIGAYRDDELDTSSVFSWVGYSVDTEDRVLNVSLGPLSETSVNDMVASLTERRPSETKELSDLVSRKTGRNAYFVTQYMEHLQRESLLAFSFQSNQWEWGLEEIKGRTDVSDNVVPLLIKKINSMPDDVQTVLMMASCLGFVVDVNALEQILLVEGILSVDKTPSLEEAQDSPGDPEQEDVEKRKSAVETEINSQEVEESKRYHAAVDQATKEGLIEQMAFGRFKFSHDRVQQAACSLLPTGEKGVQLHLCVGDILLKMSMTDEGKEWMFFAGVDLVSKFTSHFTTAESRIELARLSLEAGKIAEMKSAFIPATQYLKTGISMLDPTDRWTKNYELCLDLHTKAAEVGRTYGDCHATLCLVEETISHARSFKDKIKLLYVKMFVLAGQQKLVEAYKVCLGVLKELGVRMPSNPKTIHVLIEYAHTKRLLKGRKPRDLMLSLPQLSDELHIISLLFLDAAGMISWSADLEEHTSMVFLRMMRLTLKHGLCKYSSFAFATYGMVLAALGDRNTGYEFGRVALELNATQDGARGCISSTTVVVQSFLTHLKQPLYNSLAPMMEGHQIGMQTGEIEFAALCLSGHGGILVALGTNLESLEKSFLNYVAFFREYGQGMADGLSAPWLQFAMNLRNKALDPLVLTGDAMNEAEFVRHSTANKHMVAVHNMNFVRMVLLYILGELEGADHGRRVWEQGSGEGSHFLMYFVVLFSGLTSLGLARKYPRKRRKYLARANRHIKKMEALLRDGCVNAMLVLRFLLAERLSLKGDLGVVRKAYDETINIAGRTGSRLVKALALERAGDFMLDRGDLYLASDYFEQAVDEFAEYGATAKVEQMEERMNLLKFEGSRSARSTDLRPRTSAQLQPKTAQTDIHKRVIFDTESGAGSVQPGRRTSSAASIESDGSTNLRAGRIRSSGVSFSRKSITDSIGEETEAQ